MELMERLAAADPLRDGESLTLDEQREADALLARVLATPVAEPRRRRPRLRPRALAVAGAACAALAAFAVIDTDGGGVIDRAVAAITQEDAVYHVVDHQSASMTGQPDREVIAESWHTSDGRLHRRAFVVRDGERGRLAEDFAGRQLPGARIGSALRYDAFLNTISESGWGRSDDASVPALDPTAEPGAQLRALQEEGRLNEAGETTVDGKRAYRLVSDTIEVRGDEIEIEYTVDAETYLPLTQHVSMDRGGGVTVEHLTEYDVYEKLPLDDATGRLLALDPHPGAECSEFAHELTERDLGFPNPCAR